jgi:hypothetical protein
MMSHEQAISSLATVLHELDVQLTSLIARECAHLIDSYIKTLPLNSSDAVASEVTTHTVHRVLRA